jgi:hypothetical protein
MWTTERPGSGFAIRHWLYHITSRGDLREDIYLDESIKEKGSSIILTLYNYDIVIQTCRFIDANGERKKIDQDGGENKEWLWYLTPFFIK